MLIGTPAGCSSEPEPTGVHRPDPTVSLIRRRALLSFGDHFLPSFDDERHPILRVEPGPSGRDLMLDGLHVLWHSIAGPPVRFVMGTVEKHGDSWHVQLSPSAAVRPGAGTIEVRIDGHHIADLDAIWSVPPDDRPTSQDSDPRAGAAKAISASRRGAYGEAIDLMIEASGDWLSVGNGSDAVACLGAAGHYARHRRRLQLAARIEGWNQQLIEVVGDEEGAYAATYRRGLLDVELGRFRTAEASLQTAANGMLGLGLRRHSTVIRQALANLFERLGRHTEALAIHDAMPLATTDADDAFRIRTNRAWVRLQAMRAGALPADYPAMQRAFAEQAARMPPGLSPTSRANLLANLALAAQFAGALPDARRALEDARGADPDGGGLWPAFLDLLDGELALVEGRPGPARQAFRLAARRAREEVGGGDSIEGWQALYGEGRAVVASGDDEAALALWRAALDMARRLAGRTSLSTTHSAFLADRRALVDDLVGMLIDRGAFDEAFRALDATRAPTLRALAAEARLEGLSPEALAEWRRRVSAWGEAQRTVATADAAAQLAPADEQASARARVDEARREALRRFDAAFAWLDTHAPLDDGDPGDPTTLVPADMALLSFARIGSEWHAFLVADGHLDHRRLSDPDDVIGPWREILTGRQRIYVIDGGLRAARRVGERAVQSADAGSAPWAEHVELVWLPYAGWLRGRSATTAAGEPLVVADPDGTLPGSRRAALAVAERAGVRALVGDAATREAVLGRLHGALWFHFDGHGVIGRGEPWQAHLGMARGEKLSLADVLAVRPQIGTVVLSGCETGVPGTLSRSESLGLAEGFLLAGAAQVVAADRVLGVDEAARFVETFYRLGGIDDPAGALRAAVAEMRASGDDAWRGWRVFGVPPRL